jgi:hypothetical protein
MRSLQLFFLFITSALTFACKKYDEDRFFSTYTPEGRLTKKGQWIIEKMTNINTGETIFPLYNKSHCFLFNRNRYTITGNSFYDTDLTQYTKILAPILQELMINPSDSVILGNSDDININENPYELTNKKETLKLTSFFSFGSYQYPESWSGFEIHQSVDMEFQIKKMSFSKMILEYNEVLRIEFKKVEVI